MASLLLNRLKLWLFTLQSKTVEKIVKNTKSYVLKALQYRIQYEENLDAYSNKEMREIISILLNSVEAQTSTRTFNLLKSQEIRYLISLIHQVDAIQRKLEIDNCARFLHVKVKETDYKPYNLCLEKAKEYSKIILPLELKSLYKIKKFSQREYKALKSILADEKALKIDLLYLLAKVFPFVSAIFLFGGYLYNKILLYQFGVNTNLYFSLLDYVTSSLDNIGKAIITIALGCALLIFKLPSGKAYRNDQPYQFKNQLQTLRGTKAAFWAFTLLLLASLLLKHTELLTYYFVLWLFLFSTTYMPVYCYRYFKNPQAVYFTLFLAIQFTALISFSALFLVSAVKDNKMNTLQKAQIINTKTQEKINGHILTGNSNYLFILGNHGKVIIYPTKNIKYIEGDKNLSRIFVVNAQ